ncbi:MAG: hypothetical protein IJ593_02035 [Lachnospiraceae bacterium]|nr:hypothetical protein [Lachnospiraceae bacterium]
MADKNQKLTSTKKLVLLVTIVKKSKIDFYLDLIESNGANLQLNTLGSGTTKSKVFSDNIGTKSVIFSVLTEDDAKKTLSLLSDKFNEVRDGKGVCWTVPLTSVMGVTFFNFLSNNKSSIIG